MSEIRLEAVGTADRAPWAALWRDYLTFYGTAMRDDVYNAAFAQIMSDDPASFQARLAWRDETAIGLVQWVWHPHLWHPSQGVVYMQDLYVAPSARGAADSIAGAANQLPALASRLSRTLGKAERTLLNFDDRSDTSRELQALLRDVRAAAKAIEKLETKALVAKYVACSGPGI